jgi:hypothetical protein
MYVAVPAVGMHMELIEMGGGLPAGDTVNREQMQVIAR